ncbi:hypothetical protein B0H15DRAFT_762473, partial [Mycena belliarum]
QLFDDAWRAIDAALWEFSHAFDRSGQRGAVAKKFGLLDPADPNRVTAMQTLLCQVRAQMAERNPAPAPTPAPPSPQVFSGQSVSADAEPSPAESAHAYVADRAKHLRPKEKVKSKGTTAEKVGNDPAADEEEEEERLPDVLPKEFRLGKKNTQGKLMNSPDSRDDADSEDVVPKKRKVRWAEFERAMRLIGLGVFQTAGSSVRFDPPAKSAHPITFHR